MIHEDCVRCKHNLWCLVYDPLTNDYLSYCRGCNILRIYGVVHHAGLYCRPAQEVGATLVAVEPCSMCQMITREAEGNIALSTLPKLIRKDFMRIHEGPNLNFDTYIIETATRLREEYKQDYAAYNLYRKPLTPTDTVLPFHKWRMHLQRSTRGERGRW